MSQDTHLIFRGNAEEPLISLLHVVLEVPRLMTRPRTMLQQRSSNKPTSLCTHYDFRTSMFDAIMGSVHS